MTSAQIEKFLNAVKDAGIKSYSFYDDISTVFNNAERSIVIFDKANDALLNFRTTIHNGVQSNNAITFLMSNIEDVRRAQISGDYESIKKFIDAYGLSLDDEQLEIILKIDRNNLVVNPITGDYHNIFHKLSQAEYDALSDEEKAKYDAHVAEEEKRYALPKGVPARIDA